MAKRHLTEQQAFAKLDVFLQQEINEFLKQVPKGLNVPLEKLFLQAVFQAYNTDRVENTDWVDLQHERPVPFEPVALDFTIGSPVTGYFNGEEFYNFSQVRIANPVRFKYLLIP